MRAFLFYIDDWLSSKRVKMMDAEEERGYFRLLLAEATEPDCGLPDDDNWLATISLLGQQWFRPTKDRLKRIAGQTSGQKIRESFEARNGRLYNTRLVKEWEHQQKVQAARKESGAKGGRPPKANGNQTESKRQPNDIANEKQNETNDVCVYGFLPGLEEKQLEEFLALEYPGFGPDESFHPFIREYYATGKPLLPKDFIEAHWSWRVFDYEQKFEIIESLKARKKAGMLDDPSRIHLPKNYLAGEWKRKLPAPKKAPAEQQMERI